MTTARSSGLRLAMRAPERVAALIIQNGDIYEDELGPKYEVLRAFWADPTPEGREQLAANVSEEGFRDEFIGDLPQLSPRGCRPTCGSCTGR